MLMAAAALKLGEQKSEKMGLPCEKDTNDQPATINHESKGAALDSGEVLDSSESQKMEPEGQMPGKQPKTNSHTVLHYYVCPIRNICIPHDFLSQVESSLFI